MVAPFQAICPGFRELEVNLFRVFQRVPGDPPGLNTLSPKLGSLAMQK